jgi:hypothetical protein
MASMPHSAPRILIALRQLALILMLVLIHPHFAETHLDDTTTCVTRSGVLSESQYQAHDVLLCFLYVPMPCSHLTYAAMPRVLPSICFPVLRHSRHAVTSKSTRLALQTWLPHCNNQRHSFAAPIYAVAGLSTRHGRLLQDDGLWRS